MPDLPSILISAATAFAVALGLLYLAHKAGLTDIQREVNREADRLATTLRGRIEVLEQDNRKLMAEYEQLSADFDYLKRENVKLAAEVAKLTKYILMHQIEGLPDGR